MSQNVLVIIAGPTAIGKSSLAMELAEEWNCDILSADSRQVYSEMSIGTAKPSIEELARVKHHFINHRSVLQSFSAGDFERESIELLNSLFLDNSVQIMTGGTGLYLEAVMQGLNKFPDVSQSILDELEKIFKDHGLEPLVAELKLKDPEYCITADLQNPRRVLRALSVIRASNQPFSSFWNQKKRKREFEMIPVLLSRPKEELHHRIHQRCDQMLEMGWLQEAKDLYPHRHLKALQTVGYKELFEYLDGQLSWEETVVQIKTKTRQYAKRQLTWFAKHGEWHTQDARDKNDTKEFIHAKIKQFHNLD